MLACMLVVDPQQRITLDEILNTAWYLDADCKPAKRALRFHMDEALDSAINTSATTSSPIEPRDATLRHSASSASLRGPLHSSVTVNLSAIHDDDDDDFLLSAMQKLVAEDEPVTVAVTAAPGRAASSQRPSICAKAGNDQIRHREVATVAQSARSATCGRSVPGEMLWTGGFRHAGASGKGADGGTGLPPLVGSRQGNNSGYLGAVGGTGAGCKRRQSEGPEKSNSSTTSALPPIPAGRSVSGR
jgi:hypothetical protein